MFGASSELASVMEFSFYRTCVWHLPWDDCIGISPKYSMWEKENQNLCYRAACQRDRKTDGQAKLLYEYRALYAYLTGDKNFNKQYCNYL